MSVLNLETYLKMAEGPCTVVLKLHSMSLAQASGRNPTETLLAFHLIAALSASVCSIGSVGLFLLVKTFLHVITVVLVNMDLPVR